MLQSSLLGMNFLLSIGLVFGSPVSFPLFFEPLPGANHYFARGKGYQAGILPQGIDIAVAHRQIPIRWRHASPTSLSAAQIQEGASNYLLGNDASNWRRDVPHFSRVEAKDVYPGIDIAFYGKTGTLEFDVVVAPGADPTLFEMDLGSAKGIAINRDGELSLDQSFVLKKPVAYQQIGPFQCRVPARYRKMAFNLYGFTLGSYNKSLPLVIDPVLSYSTYFGGSLTDQINAIAADNAGNLYIAGSTTSTDLPGAPVASNKGSLDAFVAKLNSSGTAVIYATYIGGTGQDSANGIAIDAAGTVYLTGQTASTNFPVSANAPQTQLNGGSGVTDAFALHLNGAGNSLIYSTYLGGSASDNGKAIAIDAQGNAFIGGATQSTNFPGPNNPDFPPRGGGDGFVTKIDPGGTQFLFSIYLGGFAFDSVNSVAVDSKGSVYAAGETRSDNFPVTTGSFQQARNGISDAFISKISNSGTIEYSTYLGGDGSDAANAIAVDSQGSAYITGQTFSSNFPTTLNSIQPTAVFLPDSFVTKLNPSGTGFIYSTYLGGSGDDAGFGIALDSFNNAFVTGETSSIDFPLKGDGSGGGFENQGALDAFIVKVNFTGTAFPFASQLGGAGNDSGRAVAVNGGRIYLAGVTSSPDFRTTANAIDPRPAGDTDGFIARFSEVVVTVQPASISVGPGEQVQFSANILNAAINPAIRWMLFPSVGALDANGLYSAPSSITQQQTVVVSATSVLDPSKFAESAVTLLPTPSLTITPRTILLVAGQRQQFTISLPGIANQAVTWSLTPNLGTISPSGLYTSPPAIDAPVTITVRAVSVADPTRSGTAVITLSANFPITTAAGVVNAASFSAAGIGVAPGLIVTVFGADLGPDAPATAKLNSQGFIDTNLGETRVLFDGVASPMIATSPGQISAIVPYAVAGKISTQLQVEYQGKLSTAIPIPVVATAPGVFTANASGAGQAAALNEDNALNSTVNPIARGSILTLFATGEGQTLPTGVDGKLATAPLPRPAASVTVTIGGADAPVVYVGGAPGLTAGLLQINVRVPTNAPVGAAIPLLVKIGGTNSQAGVTVSIR